MERGNPASHPGDQKMQPKPRPHYGSAVVAAIFRNAAQYGKRDSQVNRKAFLLPRHPGYAAVGCARTKKVLANV
jgi:hypothetical protein